MCARETDGDKEDPAQARHKLAQLFSMQLI